MADFDANSAECNVYTFKEGLLSSVAHDLKLRVARFSLKVDADQVEGRWDAGSLEVACVMRDGREAPGVLARRDFDKIAKNIREDVLSSRRHPEIVFRSEAVSIDGTRATIRGSLTLAGKTRALAVDAERKGDRWVAEVKLHQPDFGIKPYSAMFGTLKVKPDVEVVVSLPADAVDPAGAA